MQRLLLVSSQTRDAMKCGSQKNPETIDFHWKKNTTHKLAAFTAREMQDENSDLKNNESWAFSKNTVYDEGRLETCLFLKKLIPKLDTWGLPLKNVPK